MPADHLNKETATLAEAVLAVLAGNRLDEIARAHGMEPTELATAVDLYHRAGRSALARPPGGGWWQFSVEFPDWATAEATAVRSLAPVLHRAERDGAVWWFIRKHPCWRLRVRPVSEALRTAVAASLDQLTATGRLRHWSTGTYEAETGAFGGPIGMEAAHALFHADSRMILTTAPRSTPLGRRELSILLCTGLFRGAGLEWYEQGDAWERVTLERPLPSDVRAGRLPPLVEDLRHLLRADLRPEGPLLSGDAPAAAVAGWVRAFEKAGRGIGTAAREGTLSRGLRQVLAYHVIFHWNRLGLPGRTQSVLASAARAAILEAEPPSRAASSG
ncbi:thiopeptide-type bacteriocin biosynthesis domain-containing protein [Streptomyces zhaozhouensis]|uniref:Thiopeptide-type bacteriocin biosynthesis domain-containing protein n=1 Tax=Streptomyces zhaozhouensis TaxID=1300267 RepID=A0A286EA62_9ACTN|nr:thiopeptide-type bacteriocin biosynthesis protein [Streptomyces zhaozhouensis]SOD67778.1 thiopeptide-type bacteriocin biosynthesis domain-containing protein [Streptomyces zhaozhouensis]